MTESRKTLLFLILTAAAAVGLASCQSTAGQGTALLAAPPAGAAYSDFRPEQPYVEAAPGALRRTVFEADSGEGYRIEIQDLLVGPDREASGLTLPGAAVLEVRSGSGTITHGGETQKLETGTTLAVEAGEEIGLRNASATALTVRAFILVAR